MSEYIYRVVTRDGTDAYYAGWPEDPPAVLMFTTLEQAERMQQEADNDGHEPHNGGPHRIVRVPINAWQPIE